TATSIQFSIYPTGAVSHKGISITPVDALGRFGATTPLIAYNTIAPPPPPEPVNVAPVTNAGPDQAIALPHTTVTLNGSATDDGLPNPPSAMSFVWSVVSGPGTVDFSNTSALSTTASFSIAGTYTLRLTASDGELNHQDDLIVTVNPEPLPVNTAPVSNAGSDQDITLPDNSVTLNGSATDDGLPGAMSFGWSVVSGPGTVDFSDLSALSTTASFSIAGTYTLRLTVNDGELSGSDDLIVTLTADSGTPPPYDPDAQQVELQGSIQEVGSSYIKLSGVKVWYTASTVIKFEDGNGNSFEVGQSVELKGSQNTDGSATAKKIQVGG
ncbi:MAG: hypothetical protein GY727_10895, partial [Gammaproteobacteria bacterium]|nr:hypothetical protein [Gammaproteobacteria bacterium]